MSKPKNTRRGRAVKHKNMAVEVTDNETEDMEITNLKHVATPPQENQVKTKDESSKTLMIKDFDVQANTFLENIEQAFKEKKRAIEMAYTKMKLKMHSDILSITYGEYLELRRGNPRAVSGSRDASVQSRKASSTRHSSQAVDHAEPASSEHMQPVVEQVEPEVSPVRSKETNAVAAQPEVSPIRPKETKAVAAQPEVPPVRPKETKAVPEQPEVPPARLRTVAESQSEADKQLVLRRSVLAREPRIVLAKFDPSKVVNPARHAMANEVSVSLTGSPIIATSSTGATSVNLNIPLQNGKVLAILPKPMSHMSHMPEVSDEVLEQIHAIEANLGIVKRLCLQHRAAPDSFATALTPRARK